MLARFDTFLDCKLVFNVGRDEPAQLSKDICASLGFQSILGLEEPPYALLARLLADIGPKASWAQKRCR